VHKRAAELALRKHRSEGPGQTAKSIPGLRSYGDWLRSVAMSVTLELLPKVESPVDFTGAKINGKCPALLPPLRGVRLRHGVNMKSKKRKSVAQECAHGQNARIPRKRRIYVTANTPKASARIQSTKFESERVSSATRGGGDFKYFLNL
jgi:hypothetical protein